MKGPLKGKAYDITMAEGATLNRRESDGQICIITLHSASGTHVRWNISSAKCMDTAAWKENYKDRQKDQGN